ncbi:MAG: UvrABC system protein A [Microgenomates group bacterium GW2011_GWF2_45_18]|nr:MAG: UvrABC system protein A [Microgenomates group bacterium GW2011_GWF1_44_10]KKU02232.1 MAG: UvrABC system protein A [Microgenomates group bacterium GW2011_GWF2_45_18]OGJ40919.1 MAG: excinuclease ABC subunit A [Candidatus Pacebacteria bacterium RIFOXYB1_FULL_44_10]HAX01834.1 excinuclease ABC subunit UvrA [Candidatus Paceibacterota bacterium]
MDQEYIRLLGVRQHNLKNISMNIPKHKFVVLTGMSGSGKSSLAFDTLFAEGQRRYVESLSSYARQFLGVMGKPDMDSIEGLSPAIAIDQKTTSHNPRSTVGTITEIYDYLRVLFARVGHPHCSNCGEEISQQSVDQIVDRALSEVQSRFPQRTIVRAMILSPVVRGKKGEFQSLFSNLRKQGFLKLRIDGAMYSINDDLVLLKNNAHSIDVLFDRFSFSKQSFTDDQLKKEDRSRFAQSVEQALRVSDGLVTIVFVEDDSLQFPEKPKKTTDMIFSEKFMCSNCGTSVSELEPRIFSFNTPHGACETCHGLGNLLKIDPSAIVAPSLTVSEGAIIPFAQRFSHDTWYSRLVDTALQAYGSSLRSIYEEMPKETQDILLFGDQKEYEVSGENKQGNMTRIHEKFTGVVRELERMYSETESDYIRQEIEQYMRKERCPSCLGKRLKKESLSVSVDALSIADVTELAISKALLWSQSLHERLSNDRERFIAQPILKEITSRLHFLSSVGLNYLSLAREASTLAGGELQRIRLASQIGTGLTGVLYVLDEPTIGLHQRDNQRLIETLLRLRDLGNSVVVVEHDRDTMLAADYLFDFGPKAGKHGGEIVAEGTPAEIASNPRSLTGQYLSGKKKVTIDQTLKRERKSTEFLKILGAQEHNLQNIDVSIPLGMFVCITGVSGSGKSTLLNETIYTNLAKQLGYITHEDLGKIDEITVPSMVKRVCFIDQSPIGRTPRSNPATYTKLFDGIRDLFSLTGDAKSRGYTSGRFSFNVKGGRCESCRGEGQMKIEMQFLPDMYVTCDVCKGARYNAETLEVKYRGKSIADVLALTVDEAIAFFTNVKQIQTKLQTLQEVGLGYMQLGQPAPTLSGGEAQRVKLARELSTRTSDHTVYLLDEPTTGLHFEDIQNLLHVLDKLVKANNTVIVIEHTMDVIRNADWIIDLGPEGGDEGGKIVAQGTPDDMMKTKDSITGACLRNDLERFA